MSRLTTVAEPRSVDPPTSLTSRRPSYEDNRIVVCVRARPLNAREMRGQGLLASVPATPPTPITVTTTQQTCLQFHPGNTISISDNGNVATDLQANLAAGTAHVFTLDHVYPPDAEQSAVYTDIGKPVLASSFQGFNTCIFAYGQTGSGKSYCMMGPDGGRDLTESPGIVPRLCVDLFAEVKERSRGNNQDRQNYVLTNGCSNTEGVVPPRLEVQIVASYLEIYHEHVRCLLQPQASAVEEQASRNLRVRQHPTLGVYVEGLKEVPVATVEQVVHLMQMGNENRHTAATRMNEMSSRSHAIFTLTLIQRWRGTTRTGEATVTELQGKMQLVDLAGSERVRSTRAQGGTLLEGAQINKSLSVLGLVIKTLSDASEAGVAPCHVPYRDSILTFILRESLGGNSKTFMLATISPVRSSYDETLSTLRYANRAKAIVSRAFVNESIGDKRIRELEEEVIRLRQRIHDMLSSQRQKHNSMHRSSSALAHLDEANADTVDEEAAQRQRPSRPESSSPLLRLPEPRSEGGEGIPQSRTSTQDSSGDGAAVPEWLEQEDEDIEGLIAEIERSEEVLKQFAVINLDAEEAKAAAAVVEAVTHHSAKARSLVRLERQDPYLVNLSGFGEWLVAYVSSDRTYVVSGGEDSGHGDLVHNSSSRSGSNAGESGVERHSGSDLSLSDSSDSIIASRLRASRRASGKYVLQSCKHIAVPTAYSRGVSTPHFVLKRRPTGSVVLCPTQGCRTHVNGSSKPLTDEHVLVSGDLLTFGDDGFQLRFVDPAAPPLPSRSAQNADDTTQRQGVLISATSGCYCGAMPAQADPHVAPEQLHTTPLAATDTVSSEGTRSRMEGVLLDDVSAPISLPTTTATTGSATMEDARRDHHTDATTVLGQTTPPPDPATDATAQGRGTTKPIATRDSEVAIPPPTIPTATTAHTRRVTRTCDTAISELPVSDNTTAHATAPALSTSLSSYGAASVSDDEHTPTVLRQSVTALSRHPRALLHHDLSKLNSRQGVVAEPPAHHRRPRDRQPPPAATKEHSINEESCFGNRYTYLLLGPTGGGKTSVRENLARQATRWWLPGFLHPYTASAQPHTFGVDISMVHVAGGDVDMTLTLMELGGVSCFSWLQGLLPTHRLTYILCCDLSTRTTLEDVQPTLEHMLCLSSSADVEVFIIGTHVDTVCPVSTAVQQYERIGELESHVSAFFHTRQPNISSRPRVIGRCVVDNVRRTVHKPGFGEIQSFPKLLQWLGAHAHECCRYGGEATFPNGLVPVRCLALASRLSALAIGNTRWLTAAEYDMFAQAVDARYGSPRGDLHTHTQLLASWGAVCHQHRSVRLNRRVVVDVPWVMQILACVSCCSVANVHGQSTVLITAPGALKILFGEGALPFTPERVLEEDTFGLLPSGIVSTRVLSTLLDSFTQPPGAAPYTGVTVGIVAKFLLECDWAFPGSRLAMPQHLQRGAKGEVAASAPLSSADGFLLVPSTFRASVPQSIVLVLPKCLSGPVCRFSFNMTPPHFFAKLVARIATSGEEVCSGIYVGPFSTRVAVVSGDDACVLPDFLCTSDDSALQLLPLPVASSVVIPVLTRSGLWSTAVWVIGPGGCRALLRSVRHSLCISFDALPSRTRATGSSAEARLFSQFCDGLLQLIRSVVSEYPGLHCEEYLLCHCASLATGSVSKRSGGKLASEVTAGIMMSSEENLPQNTYYRLVRSNADHQALCDVHIGSSIQSAGGCNCSSKGSFGISESGRNGIPLYQSTNDYHGTGRCGAAFMRSYEEVSRMNSHDLLRDIRESVPLPLWTTDTEFRVASALKELAQAMDKGVASQRGQALDALVDVFACL